MTYFTVQNKFYPLVTIYNNTINIILLKKKNSISTGYVNKIMQIEGLKTWDIYLHWLRDKEKQNHFQIS